MSGIRLFCPATVANVSCGFDVLGLAVADVGDEMIFKRIDTPGVRIANIEGAELPYDPELNAAGVVAQRMLEEANSKIGIEISMKKNIKPGSGLGSSAASAGGAAVGVNLLLDRHFSKLDLVRFAMEGEYVACGARIADNVSPVITGGFCLVRSYLPLDVVGLPVPNDLHIALLHPQVEIKTSESRAVLPKEIPMTTATRQCGNLGGLITALFQGDYDLLSRSLHDHFAEPYRARLIPKFVDVRSAAMEAGALGGGISGSGPSMYYLCKGRESAEQVSEAMRTAFAPSGIEFMHYTTAVSMQGAHQI